MKRHKFINLALIIFFTMISTNCSADIILKLIGANPSKEQAQSITLKAYLPKEIGINDVLDAHGLKVMYDTQEGAYYVHGEQELAPGETVQKRITLRNVWVIDQAEIDSMRAEAQTTLEFLRISEYKDRAAFLAESIEKRLGQIELNQNRDFVNPQQHISIYRENIKHFESVKEDLIAIRSLLSQVKRLPSMQIMKLIFIVVGFLTFLSVALYFVWHKQANDFSEN